MNLALVEQATEIALRSGYRSLQVHSFAPTQREHNARLVQWAEFEPGSRVVDMGSGVGEFARAARLAMPSLDFYLVNLSQYQLDQSPEFESHCGSYLAVPLPDGSCDAITFLFSIGHEDQAAAFNESFRLLRRGGILFVYDMVRVHGSNESMASVQYTVHPRSYMERLAQESGFKLDVYIEPHDDGSYGRFLFGKEFDAVFDGTQAAIWRWVKP